VRVHALALRSGTDASGNVPALVAAVAAAAADGAEVVVLPEYAVAFDPRGVGPELAEPLDGPSIGALARAASEHGVTVLVGTAVPTSPGRAANLVVALGADGTVLGEYRKVHLYDAFGHRESDRLDAGPVDAPPLVLPVAGLRLGVMTCYDLRFPEAARRLVDAGADVLVVPAAWADGPDKADHWRTLLRARAIESTAYVIGAVQSGPGVTGVACVVDPLGRVVTEVADGAAVADLSADVVAQVRERNPSLRNRRYRVVPDLPGPVN
jgi:deaminated glutathione amidase